ncbi:MAG: hypothetical protein EZS28_027816 [Streblomastix strix]|uniref:SPRY domain-containing protein n=1 Tax=Streblomastix strix TaxID=222440 RepID=A0A5J4V228_9EUKA|nr:MAG: hypothetical protein EZS28_027816 [Streblomastix strix]
MQRGNLQFNAKDRAKHYRLSARFNGKNDEAFRIVGVVYAWQGYAGGFFPGIDKQSVGYNGKNGRIYQGYEGAVKVDPYNNGDTVTLDVYMPPKAYFEIRGPNSDMQDSNQLNFKPVLTFSVNGVEQSTFVTNLPQSIRFCVSRFYAGTSVDILELSERDLDVALPNQTGKNLLPWG